MKTVKTLEKLGYNPHSIGITMKELVIRAINLIRQRRFNFEMSGKVAYDGKGEDVYSNTDTEAQIIYLKGILENFPKFGVIAEEDRLVENCQIPGHDIYFTIDPLCGTKAFGSRQSYGIATMFALVVNGEVAAAYIGDVIAREVYGYRPGSNKVWRIWRTGDYDRTIELEINTEITLAEQWSQFTEDMHKYSELAQSTVSGSYYDGVFRRHFSPLVSGSNVMSGSIGLHYARLWNGEVGLLVLPAHMNTPWDTTPVIGISEKLGFVHVYLSESGHVLKDKKIELVKELKPGEHEILVFHKSRIDEFVAWHKKAFSKAKELD